MTPSADMPYPLSYVTLTFSDRDTEARYRTAYTKHFLVFARIAVFLGSVFLAAFGPLDYYLMPELTPTLWTIRFGVLVPAGLVCFMLTFVRRLQPYMQLVLSAGIAVSGLGIVAMTTMVSDVAYDYYAGLMHVMIFAYVTSSLRFWWATATCTVVLLTYFILSASVVDLPTSQLVHNGAFLLCTNFLGMAGSYTIELYTRRNFILVDMLERERAKVRETNDRLEVRVQQRTAQLHQALAETHKEMEERIQAQGEKQAIQKQLFQAQKMEAVGLLAGGIAHDFNNLLTVIIGNATLALHHLGRTDIREDLQHIVQGANKAAALTRQLLLFGRKQPMKVSQVNIAESIGEMSKMIGRLLGERIRLTMNLPDDLLSIRADDTLIGQVVMNLVVNARDAMPRGGSLTIRARNHSITGPDSMPPSCPLSPGEYVVLSVEDTGCGMDKQTLAQVFEPFFTTKEKGKGTGLGLAVVYGIVRDHGGWIDVETQPDKGTAFHIYLQGSRGSSQPRLEEADLTPAQCRGAGQRVLLVEDDDDIRAFGSRVLSENGYEVSTAEHAERALELLTESREFVPDILVSDVILPGIDGLELVNKAKEQLPAVRCVLCSGYTGEQSRCDTIREQGIPFLRKPYTLEELLGVVWETWHGEEAGGDGMRPEERGDESEPGASMTA